MLHTGMHGPTSIFWANLTPFWLQRTPEYKAVAAKHAALLRRTEEYEVQAARHKSASRLVEDRPVVEWTVDEVQSWLNATIRRPAAAATT